MNVAEKAVNIDMWLSTPRAAHLWKRGEGEWWWLGCLGVGKGDVEVGYWFSGFILHTEWGDMAEPGIAARGSGLPE